MRKYVFSSTLTTADWNNATIIPGDPVAAVRELEQQGDRHLVIYGYGQLPQTLSEHGLVDKLNFVVNPVMAGSGTTLFCPRKHEPAPGRRHRAPQRRGYLVLRKRLKDAERNRQDRRARQT